LITETFLSIFEGVPVHHISLDKIKSTIPIIDFLVESKILSSKEKQEKLVQTGGLA